MKILKILLSMLMVTAFAPAAMAVSVNLSIDGGASTAYNLNSMSIGSDGTIGLSVTSPSGGGTECTNTAPTISAATTSFTTTAGTSVSTTYTANANDSGQTASVSASAGSASGGTWSWTPTTSGTFYVTLTANDGQTCNNTASVTLTVNVSASGGGGTSNCINLGPQYPKIYGCTSSTISSCSPQVIPSHSAVNYCLTIDKATVSNVTITMSSADWVTSSHEFVSNIANPTLSEVSAVLASGSVINRTGNPPWYSLASGSNERLSLNQTARQGDKYYITVYNPGSTSSKIILYWVAY